MPSSSTYLPPPPGPPGIYLRFLGGGSEEGFAAPDLSGAEAGFGRVLRALLDAGRLGVSATGVMLSLYTFKTLRIHVEVCWWGSSRGGLGVRWKRAGRMSVWSHRKSTVRGLNPTRSFTRRWSARCLGLTVKVVDPGSRKGLKIGKRGSQLTIDPLVFGRGFSAPKPASANTDKPQERG